jgi:hypothetical protein
MADMIAEQTFDETQALKALLEYYRARVVEAPTVVEAPPPALAPSPGADQTSEDRPTT